MATGKDVQRLLWEQSKIKETLATDGAKIIAAKLHSVARETLKKEMKADPFTHPEEIVKARQLRLIINKVLPGIIDGLVNYDPDAPDEQVLPDEKFSLIAWVKNIFKGEKPER